jgi:ubiquinone/menaquinone biosynthesis C-methylase UbiE
MSQNEIFSQGEGDAWYRRNKSSLQSPADLKFRSDMDFLCRELGPLRGEIGSMLEIGASSGLKLEYICDQLECRGHGIDPSELAVIDGNARAKKAEISLSTGRSDKLDFADGSFDLVYFGFSLYFCDRDKILRSLSEADRVLRPGGFLAITDFDPEGPKVNQYIHRPGIFSFKQDYSTILLATSAYHLMAKRSYSHHQDHFDHDPDERVATWILYKRPSPDAG